MNEDEIQKYMQTHHGYKIPPAFLRHVGVLPQPPAGGVLPQPQPGVVLPRPQPGVVLPRPQPGVVLHRPQPGVVLPQSQPGVVLPQPPPHLSEPLHRLITQEEGYRNPSLPLDVTRSLLQGVPPLTVPALHRPGVHHGISTVHPTPNPALRVHHGVTSVVHHPVPPLRVHHGITTAHNVPTSALGHPIPSLGFVSQHQGTPIHQPYLRMPRLTLVTPNLGAAHQKSANITNPPNISSPAVDPLVEEDSKPWSSSSTDTDIGVKRKSDTESSAAPKSKSSRVDPSESFSELNISSTSEASCLNDSLGSFPKPRLKVRVDILKSSYSELKEQAEQSSSKSRDVGKDSSKSGGGRQKEERRKIGAAEERRKIGVAEERGRVGVAEDPDYEAEPNTSNAQSQDLSNKSTVDCAVCKDVAIAHFHYGGTCCYSCKAFFRRVVNTSKATKYKCRNGKNACDVSFANRRSCQACRYRKCLAAGMKPGLVLSENHGYKRIGAKKGSRSTKHQAGEEGDDPDDPESRMETSQGTEVTREDLSLLIDGEKSYDEQNRIGRMLFISLFDTGSISTDRLEERELNKYSGIDETVAMVKSFQIERQLNHSRKYLPFNSDKSGEKRKMLCENGKINTGDLAQTLIDHTIMLLKHNKEFNSLPLSDQTELSETNLMTVTLLSVFEVYNGQTHNLTWKLTEDDFNLLAVEGIKVPHGRVSFGLAETLSKVDADLKDDLTKLFNFFDYFHQIGLPRSSLYILLLVVVFNQDGVDVKNRDEIENFRKYFLFALFETLVAAEGVLGACSIGARLHTALNDLNRIAQILGQKFIDVEEKEENLNTL